jgi:hypothetical protein
MRGGQEVRGGECRAAGEGLRPRLAGARAANWVGPAAVVRGATQRSRRRGRSRAAACRWGVERRGLVQSPSFYDPAASGAGSSATKRSNTFLVSFDTLLSDRRHAHQIHRYASQQRTQLPGPVTKNEHGHCTEPCRERGHATREGEPREFHCRDLRLWSRSILRAGTRYL